MSISNIPFPSFTLVLNSDRVVIPGPSYVIRFAPPLVSHFSTALMTNTSSTHDLDHPFVNFENDSTTDVILYNTDLESDIADTLSTDETMQSARSGQEEFVGIKFSFAFLFNLKSIFKRLVHANSN